MSLAVGIGNYFRRLRYGLTVPARKAMRVACPVCASPVAEPCTRETGEPMDEVHVARLRRFEAWLR